MDTTPEASEEESFKNLVIAQVNDYVNVFYITGYGTGRNLIPAVLFGNEETNRIVIQFTDDLTKQ